MDDQNSDTAASRGLTPVADAVDGEGETGLSGSGIAAADKHTVEAPRASKVVVPQQSVCKEKRGRQVRQGECIGTGDEKTQQQGHAMASKEGDLRSGRLCVASRRPHPKRHWIQTQVVGYTTVTKPPDLTNSSGQSVEEIDLTAEDGVDDTGEFGDV
ncbi:hypothetical protein PInf_022906 [Phytophthora infestans]|nr:hypothetical protein PInf_022906 [Phytophthora infestans]